MKVFAHRGASGDFPENTLVAFEQAIAQQADGIELDVQYHSGADKWYVIHDFYVDTTTSGSGLLKAMLPAELACLRGKDELPLPTLEQALSAIAGRCPVNIEIKEREVEQSYIELLVEDLRRRLAVAASTSQYSWSSFILSSFNHSILHACKAKLPQVKTGALIANIPTNLSDCAAELKASSLNIDLNSLNKVLVDHAHQQNIELWVYTVDRPEDVRWCMELGVDAIFSNFPQRSKALIHDHENQ
ncbi:glycerophosphodiester phosphodiesterase [Thalassotalea euphylliae]|uniref:glycerophosphodiester phosphodiesterase n=1 Tax=Thalassotalea euphylliae TaxID=1655234 RepID=UPI003632D851